MEFHWAETQKHPACSEHRESWSLTPSDIAGSRHHRVRCLNDKRTNLECLQTGFVVDVKEKSTVVRPLILPFNCTLILLLIMCIIISPCWRFALIFYLFIYSYSRHEKEVTWLSLSSRHVGYERALLLCYTWKKKKKIQF